MIHIFYSDGRVLQGILLAVGERTMRVSVRDFDDVAEFRQIRDVWVSEECDVVRIAFAERFAGAERFEPGGLDLAFGVASRATDAHRVM
jgi:hypothetical protein